MTNLHTTSLLLATALATQAPSQDQQASRVDTALTHADRLVAPLIEGGVAVGVAVGVLYDGETGTRGYGQVRKGGKRQPDHTTLYEIGSISKVFTGVLLADAVHRGLVGLDDPVQKHTPKDTVVPRFEDQVIRLAHLSAHTSALPRMPVNFGGADPKDPFAHYTRELLYQGLAKTKLQRAPGKDYAYSNLAAGLLGQILTDIQGADDYQALLRSRICAPLGLRDTCVRPSAMQTKRFAPAYTDSGSARHSWAFDSLVGCGGIRSTTTDMLTFAAAALGLTTLDGDKAHLQPAFALAQKPIYRPGFLSQLSKPAVGCGWHLGPGKNLIWHNGATGGYRAMLMLDTKAKCAVVVLSNTTSKLIDTVAQQVYRATAGKNIQPVKVRPTVRVPAATLRSYVGKYRLGPDHVFDIALVDGSLTAQLTGQQAMAIAPASPTRFFYRSLKAEVEFTTVDGKVTQLVLHQHGRQMPAKRL